jgi:hypothetical protein
VQKGGEMKCTVEEDKECNNINFEKCKECIAPTWCMCLRKGAAKDVNRVFKIKKEKQIE